MKINSFFDKDSVNTSKKLQITASGVQNIVNTASVERLETEIEALKSKLEIAETNLKITTERNLKDKEQFSIAIRKSKEAQEELIKLQERADLLGLDNEAINKSLENKNEIIHKLKSEVHKLSVLANKYTQTQNHLNSTINDLDKRTEEYNSAFALKENLLIKVNELEGYQRSKEIDFETMQDKYNTMSSILSKTKEDNTALRKGLNEANRLTQTWKNGFSTLQEENANLLGVKDNLTTWLAQVQEETSDLSGKSSLQDKELQQAKQTIIEMGKTVDELLSTNEYLRERNNTYLIELNKPRYTSIGAISRQEGFKLPSKFTAPKNSLGSSKPTLLKVREV